jgi:protein phosphatase
LSIKATDFEIHHDAGGVTRHQSLARSSTRASRKIGWTYLIFALALSVLCWATWPWGGVLLWPIAAVVVVTAGYFFAGSRVFGKKSGRIPLARKLLLAPVIVCQYASWLHYQRRCEPWNVVAPGVWIGRWLRDAEARDAVRQGVTAVLDLSELFSESELLRRVTYRHLPVLDLTAPTTSQLHEAVAFIDENRLRGIVLVHCKIGYSRSAAVIAAWLMATGRAKSADEAIHHLRSVRPPIVIRPEIHEALAIFERECRRG